MASQLRYHRQPRARSSSDASLFVRLRHWFKKGSQVKAANNRKAADLDVREFLNQRPARISPSTWNQDNQAAFDTLNNTPRQIPRAVQVQDRRGQNDECEDVSSLSTHSSFSASSLTSAQSCRSSLGLRDSRGKNGKHSRPDISSPKPTKSLLNLTSNYADVQNPAKAYDAANRKPVSPATTPKVPGPGSEARDQDKNKKQADKLPERKISQPIKEVAATKPQIVDAPSNHRSTKVVVRKMVPQRQPLMPQKVDPQHREWDRETRFEDFMGKQESVPPIPSVPSMIESQQAVASRLSRPPVEPLGYESDASAADDNDDIESSRSNSTAVLSPNGSPGQTWLRYDRAFGTSPPAPAPSSLHRTSNLKVRNRPDSDTIPGPLFPPRRRNRATPAESHRDAEQKKRWMKCQECKEQVHPSAAVSYNGTYFCMECANKQGKESSKIAARKP
ncbi:MAG: hypothetical protein LQ352_005840, partial [Teloschistes flavicans]